MPEHGGPIRVRGTKQQQRLVEYLVEKRVRCLEYLRHLHTSEDGLWMNTIRIGKTDLREYFRVEPQTLSLCTQHPLPPKRNAAGEPIVTVPHIVSNNNNHSTTGAGTMPSGTRKEESANSNTTHLVTSAALKPLPTVGKGQVESSWLEEYIPRLYSVGIALSELLLFPAGGAAFINAVYEVFLELDVVFATGATSRALAGRQLKNHRLAKRRDDKAPMGVLSSPIEGGVTVSSHSGSEGASSAFTLLTSKPYLLDDRSSSGNLPSYDLLIPSLCTTCMLVYRRMCDFDMTTSSMVEGEDDEVIETTSSSDFTSAEITRMILHIDRRLKKLFFGNVSKEIGKLARLRTVQHTRVLTDHVFGAYTQLDEMLLEELMHTAGTLATVNKTYQSGSSATTATSAPLSSSSLRSSTQQQQHVDPSQGSAYSINSTTANTSRSSGRDSATINRGGAQYDDIVFSDNDDETY